MKRGLKENISGSAETLGEVKLERVLVASSGGCNYCTRNNVHVNQISGKQSMIRVCDTCLDIIKKLHKAIK